MLDEGIANARCLDLKREEMCMMIMKDLKDECMSNILR